jgi:hypothetical protein
LGEGRDGGGSTTLGSKVKQGRTSFLKKRSRKLLILPASAFPDRENANSVKVSCFFFSKKKAFLPFLNLTTTQRPMA